MDGGIMRSRMAVLVACLTLAVAAWAGDPWKEKTYKEWNEEEVNKILGDSPWSRPVSVGAYWRTRGGDAPPSLGGRGGGGEGGEGGAPRSGSGASGGGGGGSSVPEAHFVLRWGSMRTVREALARRAMLHGASADEVEKRLSAPVTEHQIVLYGNDMAPFAKTDEIFLMQNTFLKLKRNKQKISPARVEITRTPDGKRVAGISFFFAMKTEAGEPVITVDEKGVDFEFRNDIVTIHQTFEPHKMVGKQGSDLQ
jgi:hypothetical protein